MLHEFITLNREEIIRRCSVKVAARTFPTPTPDEIAHGVPVFLDQLTDALRGDRTASGDIARTAVHHGHELLLKGFTVSQVVHDYGDVCQAITELAMETSAPIDAAEFRLLNACLDNAIAGAVTKFCGEQNHCTDNGESARGNERAGFLAHEMRNLLNTAIIAFEVIKTGNVGIGGSMGTLLQRNLQRAGDLIRRSLAEVRLSQGLQYPERFQLADFIEELDAGRNLGRQLRWHQVLRDADCRRVGGRGRPPGPCGGGDEPSSERVQVHAHGDRRDAPGQRQSGARPD